MTGIDGTTPQALGRELLRIRQQSEGSLEAISTRTKISRRALEALESGDYGHLPDRVFGGYFLRQYLEFLGVQDQDRWLALFEQAWHFHLRSSQPFLAVQEPPPPPRHRRIGPWLVGLLLMGVALGTLVLVERGHRDGPVENGMLILPTPVSSPVAFQSATEVPSDVSPQIPHERRQPESDLTLWVRALERSCWVEVLAVDMPPRSRLLDAGQEWQVDVGRGAVEVIVGDAGAFEAHLRGKAVRQPGRDGQVIRLHFPGSAEPDSVAP